MTALALTTQEFAKALGVSTKTVYRGVDDGRFQCANIAAPGASQRQLRFHPAEVAYQMRPQGWCVKTKKWLDAPREDFYV